MQNISYFFQTISEWNFSFELNQRKIQIHWWADSILVHFFKDLLMQMKSTIKDFDNFTYKNQCLKRIRMLFKKSLHHISLWRLNFWKLLKIHCWLKIALFANFDRTTSYLLWIHRGLLHILSLPKHMLPAHQPAKQIIKKSKKSADENKQTMYSGVPNKRGALITV